MFHFFLLSVCCFDWVISVTGHLMVLLNYLSLLVFHLGSWVVWFWLALPYGFQFLVTGICISTDGLLNHFSVFIPPFGTWGLPDWKGLFALSGDSLRQEWFLYLHVFLFLCHSSISGAKAVFAVDTSHVFGSGCAGHCPLGWGRCRDDHGLLFARCWSLPRWGLGVAPQLLE